MVEGCGVLTTLPGGCTGAGLLGAHTCRQAGRADVDDGGDGSWRQGTLWESHWNNIVTCATNRSRSTYREQFCCVAAVICQWHLE